MVATHQLLNLREARPDDTELLLDFIRELAEYERLLHEVVVDETTLETTLFADPPAAHAVIAELGDEPAGFALYHYMYSTFIGRPGLYLEDLYIRPRHRNQGIGSALLVHLARTAVEQGCCRLDWSVLNWNEPAIEFYRRIGAYPLDEWIRYRLDGDDLAALAARD